MQFNDYQTLIRRIKQGKHLPSAIYLHQLAIAQVLPANLQAVINQTITSLQIDLPWNIVKLYKRDFKVTLLHYTPILTVMPTLSYIRPSQSALKSNLTNQKIRRFCTAKKPLC